MSLPATATAAATACPGRVRVVPDGAVRIHAATEHLADLDERYGASHVPRPGASLTGHITALPHDATGPGRADVFAAAAEAAYLTVVPLSGRWRFSGGRAAREA